MTTANCVLDIHRDGGWNQLRVLQPLEEGQQRLLWQTELEGCEHRVIKAELYSEREFVVADDAGHIYCGDLQTQRCRRVHALPVRGIGGGCWLDLERQEFWYAGDMEIDPDSFESPQLMGWSLPSWQPITTLPLPDYIHTQSMVRRSDGCFLFYRAGNIAKADSQHGFYCCDPVRGHTRFHPLDSGPIPKVFNRTRVMTINARLDLALLPCVDLLPVDADDDLPRLGYQMELVDLIEFAPLWRHPVRYLPMAATNCSDEEFTLLLNHAAGEAVDGEALADALEEFTEALLGVRISDDGHAVWMEWQDGVVQKLPLCPGRLFAPDTPSPRYHLRARQDSFDGRDSPLARLNYPAWEHTLRELEDGSMLTVFTDYQQLDIAGARPGDSPDSFEVDYRICPQPRLLMSQAQQLAHTRAGKIIIELGYLALADDLLDGAGQLARLMADLPANARGQRLELLFTDRDGNQASEAQFTARAVAVPGAAALLAQAVERLCHCPGASLLRAGDSKAALSDTVLALAGHSIDHLPLLARYFNVIDSEHCAQFHMERTLPLIDDRYNRGLFHRRRYHQFIRALSWPFNGKDN